MQPWTGSCVPTVPADRTLSSRRPLEKNDGPATTFSRAKLRIDLF